MANEDLFREFRRMNEPLSYYSRGVRSALNKPLASRGALKNGFWSSTRYVEELQYKFLDNGTLHEEYAEDPLFMAIIP